MSLEQTIREIVVEEIARHKSEGRPDLVTLNEFCYSHNISRTTVWRDELAGKIKLTRIGRRVYVDLTQFKIKEAA